MSNNKRKKVADDYADDDDDDEADIKTSTFRRSLMSSSSSSSSSSSFFAPNQANFAKSRPDPLLKMGNSSATFFRQGLASVPSLMTPTMPLLAECSRLLGANSQTQLLTTRELEKLRQVEQSEESVNEELASRWFAKPLLLTCSLFEHQKNGLQFVRNQLANDTGVLIADEPGLGKTLLCVAYLAEQKNAALLKWLKAREQCHIASGSVPAALTAEIVACEELVPEPSAHANLDLAPEILYDVDLNSESMRSRVRGEPALVVVPTSALATWICQIHDRTVNMSLATLSNSERYRMDIYIDCASGQRSRQRPVRTIVGYTPEHLRSFDVLLITIGQFDELKNEDSAMYSTLKEIKTFAHINRIARNLTVIDELNRMIHTSKTEIKEVSVSPNGIYFDSRGRVEWPIGSKNRVTLSGRTSLWAVKFASLVIDEAHNAASSQADRPRVLATIATDNVIAVTATPSNNEILEFATLLWLLRVTPLLGDDEWFAVNKRQNSRIRRADEPVFDRLRAILNEKDGGSILERAREEAAAAGPVPISTDKSIDPLLRLSQMLSRVMIARRQADVPGYSTQYVVHEYYVRVPILTPVEAAVNNAAIQSAKPGNEGMFSFVLLRQAAVAPSVISHGKAAVRINTPALQRLVDTIDNTPALSTHTTYINTVIALCKDTSRIKPTEKVIVTCMLVSVMRLMERRLTMEGIEFLSVDGTTTDGLGRLSRIEEFGASKTCRILLLSMKIATSLNIEHANHIIVDTWFSPGLRGQAAGRIRRLTQKHTDLYVWSILVNGTVAMYEHTIAARKQMQNELLMFNGTESADSAKPGSKLARVDLNYLRSFSQQPFSEPTPADVVDEWAKEDPQNRRPLEVVPGPYNPDDFSGDWAQRYIDLGNSHVKSSALSSSSADADQTLEDDEMSEWAARMAGSQGQPD